MEKDDKINVDIRLGDNGFRADGAVSAVTALFTKWLAAMPPSSSAAAAAQIAAATSSLGQSTTGVETAVEAQQP